ncbi:MAG: M3 family metallopeptidase [Ideonella sp.]|nr:M3 family metallopeptidase [Ideonella sp.]
MDAETNALLADWDLPFGLPPFGQILAHQFKPALELAMGQHRDQVQSIATNPSLPDFENTVEALDRAGDRLGRIEAVFHGLGASFTSPELQAIQREMAAPVAAHWSAVYQDAALFARLDEVHRQRATLALTPEQQRLVERLHRDCVRAGAQLAPEPRARFAQIQQLLAQLNTRFGQNVLLDESSFNLPLPDAAAQAGLPDFLLAAARQAAADRKLGEVPVITLSRSLIVPFLSFSTRRDLREQAWAAWVGRGEQAGPSDNRGVAAQILRLRQEQAQLLGHAHYAELNLVDTMARTTDRVWALLDEVWQRAMPALERERALLQQAMAEAGAPGPIEPWDWRFWAERVRQTRFALDEADIKPYFALPNMVAAVFDCAERLFGLRFSRRDDLQAYHPDVVPYEVSDRSGMAIGLFLHDNFGRPEKRSGAWMSALRWQHRNTGAGQPPTLPVIVNNNNFAKAAPGEPTLLSLDDVRTLFHEFGHGLHGLLSDVGYVRLSGTKVLRDFVELPSQLFEHWGEERGVLRKHARHHLTGQAIPEAVMDRMEAARKFGSAYETMRYAASAIVDMAAHERAEPIDDLVAFEARVMAERGLPREVGMNHRLPHFQHLFSGSGYAAGYYVYLWAEVLDADAYEAFVEAGNPFDAAVAERLMRCIYSRGDSVEPGAAYRAFRGRDARLEPMLRGRGLMD